MRIVFFSYGTRGDAQPQVVLASALRERGYKVRVAAPEKLRSFVESAGVEYAPLIGNSQDILESEDGRRWLSSGNVRAFMKALGDISTKISAQRHQTAEAAAHGADAIVGGTLMGDLSFTLAQKLRVPFLQTHTIPIEMTGEYPSPLVTTAQLPLPFLNRLTHKLFRKLAWNMGRETLNQYRVSLGLETLSNTTTGGAREHGLPMLQLWSEQVLPHAADSAPNQQTTGYVRMPPSVRERVGEGAPPAGLLEWLAHGPPPVYLGFGSMPVLDPLPLAKQALAATKSLEHRVVLLAGWSDLSSVQHLASERAFFIRNVDHSWLLPQCVAAVHHGGAGTTAASLEAGVPTVICSVFADQPFWGARVTRLGVGAHVPFAQLNERTLATALRSVLTKEARERAKALGTRLRAEDGTAKAAHAIARHFGPPHHLDRVA